MNHLDGVFTAIVVDNKDPENVGRVKIRIPGLTDKRLSDKRLSNKRLSDQPWARVATLMAGNNRGTWFLPEVNDEVLVAFGHGDARQPYVLGALWSKASPPPERADPDNRKVLRSRSGLKITLDDRSGQESLSIETPGGQKIKVQDGPGSIEIADSNGNSVKLETSGMTVQAAAKVTVNASQVEISAAMVTANAGMAKFSGVVQCDTLISNSVVSSSYTPGAGNVW